MSTCQTMRKRTRQLWYCLILAGGLSTLSACATLGPEYQPWKNWSLGLGLESMSAKLQVKEESSYPGLDFNESMGSGFNGPSGFM